MDETTNTAAHADQLPADAAAPAAPKPRTIRRQRTVVVTDPVTAVQTTRDELTDEDAQALPESAALAAPFAFYDDEGKLHSWAAGQVLTDAAEIAALVEHGAIFTKD